MLLQGLRKAESSLAKEQIDLVEGSGQSKRKTKTTTTTVPTSRNRGRGKVLDINSTQCTDFPLSSYVIISLLAHSIE